VGGLRFPAGLTRVAESEGPVVSMQRGGHSKDAWVLWDEPGGHVQHAAPAQRAAGVASHRRAVPSSVADNVFWLGRYVERAENIARITRTMISRVRRADQAELGCLLRLHGCLESRHSRLPKAKGKRPTSPELERELISILTNRQAAGQPRFHIGGGGAGWRQCARAAVGDMNSLIGQLRDSVQIEPDTQFLEYPAMLTACLELLSAFSGMERENTTRGSGWLFMSIGRRLERAIYLTRQLREVTTPLAEWTGRCWRCLLEVADSSMTYRTRYFTTLQPLAVLDVLMADETNPRALDFQISTSGTSIKSFRGILPATCSPYETR
jgi:uncharacterized alpha-E superfamily protein